MDKKPNVFPSKDDMSKAMAEANETGTQIAEQANTELDIDKAKIVKGKGDLSAEEQMKKDSLDNLEEQLRKREEFFARKKAEARGEDVEPQDNILQEQPTIAYATQTETTYEVNDNELSEEEKYNFLSQPQANVPYDVIKLPSGGLLYKNHKSTVDVAYLNATDEDIITNPNLLQSGKFLEILINRKLINTPLRYKDLHVGDRNAIMIWLRATGYGPMYTIKLSDPKDANYKEFEVDVDLDKLPIKPLGAKPDKNGHFDFEMPLSKDKIKFKLLTVGDVDAIEDHISNMDEQLIDTSTFTLKKQLVSVNGNEDPKFVADFASKIRLGDVRNFRKYVDKIESGMDMNITVGTPGGESITTFLPLNLTFFWPDLGI